MDVRSRDHGETAANSKSWGGCRIDKFGAAGSRSSSIEQKWAQAERPPVLLGKATYAESINCWKLCKRTQLDERGQQASLDQDFPWHELDLNSTGGGFTVLPNMRSLFSVFVFLFAAAVSALSTSGNRLLVILDDVADKGNYSKFLGDLESV